MHDEFETLLRERFVPEPPSNLAERIIAAAKPRAKKKGFADFMDDFMELFYIPKPAYATAFILVLGLAAGIYMRPVETGSFESVQREMTSYMTAEISFYDGDLL